MKRKKNKPTKAELTRQIRELEAQLIHRLHYADLELEKVSTDHLKASSVIVDLKVYGEGAKQLEPFMIKDGLSLETIAALREDIKRTWALRTAFKPRNVGENK